LIIGGIEVMKKVCPKIQTLSQPFMNNSDKKL